MVVLQSRGKHCLAPSLAPSLAPRSVSVTSAMQLCRLPAGPGDPHQPRRHRAKRFSAIWNRYVKHVAHDA